MAAPSLKDAVCKAAESLQNLLHAIGREQDTLNAEGVDASSITPAVQHALGVITQEFDLDGLRAKPSGFYDHQASLVDSKRKSHLLGKRLEYQKRARADVKDELALERGVKMQNRVQAIWYVRAGLSNPSWARRSQTEQSQAHMLFGLTAISHALVTRSTVTRKSDCGHGGAQQNTWAQLR